jgi:uncharacterized protein (DUF4415 family)
MAKNKGIVRYTARELAEAVRRGEDKTDYARLDAMTDEEIEAGAADDGAEFDWANAEVGIPGPKQQLTVRLDTDVVDWFKGQGRGYQTRINAVLRRFVDAQRAKP